MKQYDPIGKFVYNYLWNLNADVSEKLSSDFC